MKQLLAAILIAVPSALFGQTQSVSIPIVSLDDAMRIAEESAPSMRNSQISIRSSKLGLTQAYAAFLPSISTSASYRPAQNGGATNFSSGISASIGGLFNWNTYFNISTRKRAVEVSEANAVQARFALRTTVKNQYFAVLQAQEAIATSQRQLEVARANMNLSRIRLSTGMVVYTDTLNNLISVLSAENSLMTAENALQNNIRSFSRTLGIETLMRPDPKDTANFAIIAIDSIALLGMIKDAPAAVTSRAQIKTAESSLRTARLAYIPSPSGSIGVSRSGSGESVFGYTDKSYRYSGGRPSISFSFGLQVFNGFGREASLINAREGLETAQLNYRDQQLTVESNLLNQISTIRNVERTMVIQQQQLALAEEAYRVATRKNDMGMLTELEVTNAQNSLFTAQNNMVSTRNQYRNAIAALEALVGRDLK